MVEILEKYDLLAAFGMTVYLTFFAAIGSLVIGTVLAVMRVSPVGALRGLGAFYVNTVRNTPLTLILLFCVLGRAVRAPGSPRPHRLADLGARQRDPLGDRRPLGLPRGLRLRGAAVRGQHRDTGQAEAARAIGLTFAQSMREVILPQAFRGSIAPLGSVLIALTKNTTVASIIGVAEASGLMKTIIENETAQRRGLPRLRHRLRHPHPAGRAALHAPVPTPGGEAMSAPSLLFDAPGPRARARIACSRSSGSCSPSVCWAPCCGS